MKNNGKIVTIFTETGGRGGDGFTGLVARVEGDVVKLITSIPSSPFTNFGKRMDDCEADICDHCPHSHFGSSISIPLRKITAVVAVEI